MATSVTFAKGETSVSLPAPIGGTPRREVKHQATGLTTGGTRYAYDKGIDRYEVDLSLQSLTAAEKTSLLGFFHSTTDGVVETWTYTDEDGNTYTARFLNPTLEFQQVQGGVYDIMLLLELGSMAG